MEKLFSDSLRIGIIFFAFIVGRGKYSRSVILLNMTVEAVTEEVYHKDVTGLMEIKTASSHR